MHSSTIYTFPNIHCSLGQSVECWIVSNTERKKKSFTSFLNVVLSTFFLPPVENRLSKHLLNSHIFSALKRAITNRKARGCNHIFVSLLFLLFVSSSPLSFSLSTVSSQQNFIMRIIFFGVCVRHHFLSSRRSSALVMAFRETHSVFDYHQFILELSIERPVKRDHNRIIVDNNVYNTFSCTAIGSSALCTFTWNRLSFEYWMKLRTSNESISFLNNACPMIWIPYCYWT